MNIASRHTRVRVEQDHFIPVSKNRLVETLLRQIDDSQQKQRFAAFCRLIEATYHFEHHQMSQELKQDFRLFDSDSVHSEISRLTGEQIEQVEDRFLANFRKLMEKANFRLLSQADIEVAEAEEYLFSLPVQVDWEKLDREMLGRFLEKQPAEIGGTSPPRFAERILIFHRGVGVDKTSGFLILQKVDFLVSRLLEWITKPFARRAVREPASQEESQPGTSDEAIPAAAEIQDNCVFEDRYVERINLRSTGVSLRSLFNRTLMQEPTFKELVILFRFATPPTTEAEEEAPPEDHRKVFVKAFRDIPMADLEVVFPAKRISMELVDRIKLIVIGGVGVVMVLFKLIFTAALNPLLLLATLFSVGGYAGKIFVGFKAARDRYHNLVTQSLYHKNLDNDLGVIFYVVDALEAQEFNEAVLAYFCLLQDGEMKQDQLDSCCERFLQQHFNEEVNFEVHDALAKLVREKIVNQTGDGYRALPIAKALKQLDSNWDNLFKYHGVDD
ncbi:MAG: DUF3754 domain-containing protein [Planctomycetaceae bacterium]|nr:DUF3754 domain-containing protein [Planctomycetaceae bacterium]MBT6153312.1 DUF3754 domain-containing protein [Planctomycetaceae bacterium]MBT6483231.1 DUF3754 domain-containing protein [Planctomycetaceae bacterium]